MILTEQTSIFDRALPESEAKKLRRRVLHLYAIGFQGNSDEAATQLGVDFSAIRPRCSELRQAGELVTTGERRMARKKMGAVLKISRLGQEVWERLNG